jgi:hypothetical protein
MLTDSYIFVVPDYEIVDLGCHLCVCMYVWVCVSLVTERLDVFYS